MDAVGALLSAGQKSRRQPHPFSCKAYLDSFTGDHYKSYQTANAYLTTALNSSFVFSVIFPWTTFTSSLVSVFSNDRYTI